MIACRVYLLFNYLLLNGSEKSLYNRIIMAITSTAQAYVLSSKLSNLRCHIYNLDQCVPSLLILADVDKQPLTMLSLLNAYPFFVINSRILMISPSFGEHSQALAKR
jgi:hypothetical protein